MSEETPQERQENEIEALKAIFGDQLLDNRQAIAWNVWRPLDLMLTLLPLHSSSVVGVHCSVTLHIQCCANYPDKTPKISIEKLQGISNENVAKLLTELESLAAKLCGEVMIFELAQHVQNFLLKFNKPTLSFYDEMLERKNEQERLKQHDLEKKEKEEREKMKCEIQRRQEILRGAGRLRRRTASGSVGQDIDDVNGQGDVNDVVLCYSDNRNSPVKKVSRNRSTDAPCTCNNKGLQIMRIAQRNNKKVHVGRCIDHSTNGSTTYIAIDADSGDFLIAKKYILTPTTDFQNRNRQLNLMEQDLRAMSRLKHPSLIPYNAMESVQEVTKKSTLQCMYIFRDYVIGSSLKFLKLYLSFCDGVEVLKFLRHVAIGVFSALKELHSVEVLHRDVSSANVFIDESGVVKVVGAALDVRLSEITEGGSYCDRHTKGQDIFSAAQLLLSLVCPDGTGHEIPSQLPSAAKDMFSRCLTEDERLQWSAEKLLKHAFLMDGVSQSPAGNNRSVTDPEDEEQELAKSYVSQTLPGSGHSRLNAEFEVLTWLGKGAFGDVLKVKNKLDGGFYAIKRIKLNPENVQLNKKITREVKLLSRLNHESIVRYYNAWIETIEDEGTTREEDVVQDPKTPTNKNYQASIEAVAAKLAPGVKLEWSMSEGPVGAKMEDTPDSDSDDDDGWFRKMPSTTNFADESSSSIEFEVDADNQSETIPSEMTSARPPILNISQVLYIQMEFCEKNTLRQAIDNGLYLEHFRAWRLFREIIEGLNHVHQRGMIHRDLKPVNIFLDSNDHVKIGDFGLATNAFTGLLPVEDKTKAPEDVGGSLTGQIGTALYVAPELLQGGNKMIYNQKVDIFSLGMILFEMFHRPLDTGMERMKVLTDLRSKEIVMPKAFLVEENSKQIHVIRWLLSHEPSERPSCAELLSSEHVPRPVPEHTLSALLSHTIKDRSSKYYRRLVAACLEQTPTKAEDYTYHSGLRTKPDLYLAAVKHNVVKVLSSHSALEFSPPLLTPRATAWEGHATAVRAMLATGAVCHLPHDLRLPFARHVAYTQTKQMRRYVVERVFREKNVEGFHPKEIVECAFDIVTPKTGSLWPDAELLLIAYQAASSVKLKVSITLNHKRLLTTLLQCCGVPIDRQTDLYPILVQARFGRITNLQLQTHLTSLCITNRDITNLLKLMESEVCVNEVKELVAPFITKAEWSQTVDEAISDIETVTAYAKSLGLDCSICVAPCLAYNAPQHSGVFWQLASAASTADKKVPPLFAVGGRYDTLLEEFWRIARTEKDNTDELNSSCVGFSLSLERMAAVLKKMEADVETVAPEVAPPKVLISLPPTPLPARFSELLRSLWSGGIGTRLVDGGTEVTEGGVMLAPGEGGVRALDYTGARVREHRLPYGDVLDFVKQRLNPDSAKNPDSYARTMSYSESDKSNNPNVSVTFITPNEKLNKNSKRQYENQINVQVSSVLSKLGIACGRTRVVVAALWCERALLGCMAAVIDSCDAVRTLCELSPRRRKLIEETWEELTSITSSASSQSRAADEPALFALYSIPDNVLKLVT